MKIKSRGSRPADMQRYKFVVMSNPTEGRDEEYNDWYQNCHLPELLQLDGIVSAQRFQQTRNLREGESYRYMVIYEIETDDIDAVIANLVQTAEAGQLTMSDAIDADNSYAVFYQESGEPVSGS
jgi:hypothetical protein